jgi:spermidine synthase
MQKKLLILSFIEGAVVMAAELCGAKLLAPIFGSSLYVWASVMGITLAALAGGYFFGGLLSVKSKNLGSTLFTILSLAALFVIMMPVLSYYLIPRISYLPFLVAVVIGTILLLFFPVFFLGASSPLFISMQSQSADAGKVSGTVYAVSTAGGIVSTFACGFYLIPEMGLTACLVSFGLTLFCVNALMLKLFKASAFFVLVVCLYFNLQMLASKPGVVFASDSILGHLDVVDIREEKDSVRLLKINNIIQTEMNVRTKESVSAYIHLLDTLIAFSKEHANALVLGLGGGLNANLLVQKNYETEGVELDGRIIDVAKKYFDLRPEVKTLCEDARYYLNHCTKKYTIVLIDIFKAEEQPSHVLTTESLEQLKRNLKDSALVLINWHGYMNGSRGEGTQTLYQTLVRAGFNVSICSESADENYRNLIFVASMQKLPLLAYEINSKIPSSNELNTDDRPVLERYNAEANKTWRVNYLRYYQANSR